VQVARTVELISRHHLSQLTYCKVFQGGRDTGVVPSTELLSKAGTTVTVHDLFYNLPVRQRHMSPSLVVETLKSALCKALLVLPNLSLSLLDHQAGQKLLHVAKAGSLLARLHQLFGRVKDLRIQETFVEHAKVKISALLSVAALSSRYMQLIFVNRRLVESGSLHELVSRLLEPVVSQSKAKDTHTTKTRCPFYVIVIEGTVDLDVCLHPAKTHIHFEREESVHAALTCLIGSFLAENHFTVGYSPSPVIPPPSRERQPPRSSVPVQSRPPVCQPVSQAPTTWGMAVDPVTSLPLLVHPVSGCTHNSRSTPRTLCGSDGNSTHIASAIKDATSVRVHSTVQSAGSLSSLLSRWNNPTFSAGDQAILTVATHRALSQCKFSKTSLQQIKVVGQVDRKFITCLLGTHTSGSPDLLVAVDQHAAHERVRLEALLEGLCDDQQQVQTAEVSPPLPLSLTPSQQKLARHFSAQLAAIGVQLVWREGQPLASSLPAVLMEREAAERQRGRPAVAAGVLQVRALCRVPPAQILTAAFSAGDGALPP
jgi:DNA mismatch repair protein MLH3